MTGAEPVLHRFYALPLAAQGEQTLTGDIAHRIARVLRMTPGDPLRLFDGGGREVEAVIRTVAPAAVTVVLAGDLPSEPPGPHLTLYQALIRPNRFEWLLEKATELGVAAIVPVVTARSQVRAAEFGASKLARWRRILIEASEQCGRRTLPDLREPIPFEQALKQAQGLAVLPWEASRRDAPMLGEALRTRASEQAGQTGEAALSVSIFIGPEGGFSSEETEQARAHGAVTVSLGPLVLRAETAAIAALAIAVDALTRR